MPLQCQRRNVSFSVPKTEDAKKRVLEQSQLFDVLEARIQQLQSDVVIDVQQAKVEFIKAPYSVRGKSSGKGPKNASNKAGTPKSGQTVDTRTSKSKPSLGEEKKKLQNQQQLQTKIQTNVKEKPAAKRTSSKVNAHLPGSSFKVISRSAKNLDTVPLIKKKSKDYKKLSKEIHPEVPPETSATAASAGTKAGSQKASKRKTEDSKTQKSRGTAKELAMIEELEKKFMSQWSSSQTEELENVDEEGFAQRDFILSISSYMEACVFVGDLKRANNVLLSQYKNVSQRKRLNTDVYNIMIRAWAKNGNINKIGSLFLMLEEFNLQPNLESYCSVLECMGRKGDCSPKRITRCLNQMQESGFSLDDLFSKCPFKLDEREMVLKAIHRVKPHYQPTKDVTTSQNFSSLVEDFYTKKADHNFPKLNFTQKQLQKYFKLQLQREQACTIVIDSVEASKPVTEKMIKMRELLAEQRAEWQTVLLQSLKQSRGILAEAKRENRLDIYPYLCVLKDEEYVDIMIQSLDSLPPGGQSLTMLARDLGNRVFTIYSVRQRYQNQIEKLANIYSAYTCLLAKDEKLNNILPREHWCELEAKHTSGLLLKTPVITWPNTVILELGMFMVDLMVTKLKIDSDILNPTNDRKRIPILYHMYTFRKTWQVGVIKPYPILTKMRQEAMETKLTFEPCAMPMLCPPLPWISEKFGAYLLTPSKLMRSLDGATQHEWLLEKCQHLQPVLDSLNLLGNCAWKINKPILDIIISIFNDKGCDKLDIPPPLSEAPQIPHFNPKDPSYNGNQKATLMKEVVNAKKKNSEMHSLRMDALYKLSIANFMRDDIFWFPHNMDFRGRTYPCPPYFNHLGSDVSRAVLLFAEGKPLGPKGLDWLKIHLVNLTGLKKRSSLQGRLEYADSIMEEILDSADNPLNGNKWWMSADEPWQALACCMEISYAVRSPDPTQFISHFPVHQDGSCNGLQHYAALGKDVIGATSVNLMPRDVPQDVYSGVAQQVELFRANDAEMGSKIAQVLEGIISRKLVKQTVMTVVYGVTYFGGRQQIDKRLSEIDEFPKEYVWGASQYLVRQVFSALKEMFTATREIQDWLTQSASLISKSGHTVQWVTPLGLPIIQPYHRPRTQAVKSNMQTLSIQVRHDNKTGPDVLKQKNAFPPNFIHSLDSTHMMLTALHCYSSGLTFVSVHDCFWTHAFTVDTMNKVCREQFVSLHSKPILQELSDFMIKKYCIRPQADAKMKKFQDYKKLLLCLAKVPPTGDFDLQQVKDSTYFFS
ncbi:DNA-directed RNA polymerase, mitochondrial [Aulostomus maculatus]